MQLVEQEAKALESKQKMRTFEDSAKSKKTVASMIENKENKANNNTKNTAESKKQEPEPEPVADDDGYLDEETRIANLNALKMRKGVKKGKI